MVVVGENEKRRDRPLVALPCSDQVKIQATCQEIFLESKRAVLKVCSMIARCSTLRFSDPTSLDLVKWLNSSDTA